MQNLKALSYKLRRDVVEMIMAGKAGHIGGDMSVMETMVSLYFHAMNISPENQNDPNRDMFVLSKGHCVEALYAVLAEKGFFPIDTVIKEYSQFGSKFIGHPNNKLPGIEMNSGSLGHGLPVAVGMALAQRMDGRPSRTYVVMGDGELAEGSVWEGAMSATQYKLDNLCAVVDRNRLQISGTTEEVMHQRGRQRHRRHERRLRRGEGREGQAHTGRGEHHQGQGLPRHGEQGGLASPRAHRRGVCADHDRPGSAREGGALR